MKSLFPDNPKKPRDSAIGGHNTDDALVQSEQSALQSLSGQRTAAGHISGSVHPLTTAPRGEQYADVFTINKTNREYLTGQRDKPASGLMRNTLGALFFIAASVAILFGLVVMPQSIARGIRSYTPPQPVLLIFAVMIAGVIGYVIYSWWRYYRFMNRGQLVIGKVTSAFGRWEGTAKNRNYKITIHYEVTVPDGRTLAHYEKRSSGDLGRQPIPEQGTRVALVYIQATDAFYML